METVILTKDDGIATITLNRPERLNAWNADMGKEMAAAVEAVAGDDEVRVVILAGAGRAFSAGADRSSATIDEHIDLSTTTWWRTRSRWGFHSVGRVSYQLFSMPKPTMAMIDGTALGAGNTFALACDLRIGSERAKFNFGYTKAVAYSGGGEVWLLPRIVGLGKAAEIAFFSDFVSAEEALRIGLLNRLVPSEKLAEETIAWARRLAAVSPTMVRFVKTLLHGSLTTNMDAACDLGVTCGAMLESTADHEEAWKAFIEKREPHFTGN